MFGRTIAAIVGSGFLALLASNTIATVRAEIQAGALEYRQGDTVLEGWLVRDTEGPAKKPGVVIAHQWKGLTDYEKKRAEMLAKLGYVVLCADIYGKGVRAATPQEAGALAGKYKGDRPLLRARMQAALAALREQSSVDTAKVGAMGYCFGGTAVLELARSGADIAGIVSFHGGLGSPTPEDARKIRCRVLALHGGDDPHVPAAEVQAFEDEMRKAGVDWQLLAYGGAVHSFTDWNAGSDNSKGAAYNEKADKRSWEAMKGFFGELLH